MMLFLFSVLCINFIIYNIETVIEAVVEMTYLRSRTHVVTKETSKNLE